MVTGTDTYVISKYIEAPPRSKFSREAMNKFVIDVIDLDQVYFWTSTWQVGEKEADQDIKKGRVGKPGSAKDVIHRLRSKRK